MQSLVDLLESGIPQFRHKLPELLREYFQFRHGLYTVDGVVLYKDRVVIFLHPSGMRCYPIYMLHTKESLQ